MLSITQFICTSQIGFYKGGKFQHLQQIETPYCLTSNVSQETEIGLAKSGTTLAFSHFAKKASLGAGSSHYISNAFTSNGTDTLYIAPRIIAKVADKEIANTIQAQFSDVISIESIDGLRCKFICNCSTPEDVLNIANQIYTIDGVKWAKPEIYSKLTLLNTYYGSQYYLKNTGQNYGELGIDINVEPAWEITNGSSSVKVAVIDCGVDFEHEDLQNRILSGYTIGATNNYGAPINANKYSSWRAHGTACAGIIAANNNDIGIRGIASNVKILPVNIFVDELTSYFQLDYISDAMVADAIIWAADRADVLSCSWAYLTESDDIDDAIAYARTSGRNNKGCVVVFASGNSAQTTSGVAYPANCEGVLTVGAIDKHGDIWYYSQRGPEMDLVAPSGDYVYGDVYTTDRMGSIGYETNSNYTAHFGGTSAACPQVAGVAALLLSLYPNATESLGSAGKLCV